MTPDIEKIEHLLNAKAFAELNAAERELVLAHLSGATEYEHMRETLVRVKKVFVAEAASLAADADLKEQILNRFEQNKAQHPSLTERVGLFFQTLVPSPMGRLAGALALLLIVLSVGFWVWPKQPAEMAQQLLPPATEPQIVTLMDNTPPPITLAVEKARAAAPVQELEQTIPVTGQTAAPGKVAYDVVARADQDEFIVAGFAVTEKEMTGKGSANSLEDLKPGEQSKYIKDEQSPPVYMNQEGLYQYQNSRVADAGIKGDNSYSDAFKNYTPQAKAKKAENEGGALKENANVSPQRPVVASTGSVTTQDGEKTVVMESKLRKSTSDATGSGASATEEITISSRRIPAAPVPVWPGVEGQANAYTATLESVKAFFGKETGMAYRTIQQSLPGRTVRLSLTFNPKGVITKVHVSGDVNEAQKKAFIQRALQLPAFHFTTGTHKPLLEQTYILELY